MQELDHQHIRRISRYLSNVNGLYSDLIKEVANATIGVRKSNKLFRFKDYKRVTESVDQSLKNYHNRLVHVIHGYSKKEWDFANAKVDQLVNEQLTKFKSKITTQSDNYEALEKFKTRKINEISLIDRVATITKRMRTNFEVAIDVSLEDGLNSTQLACRMKSELMDINQLLRKVKTKHGSVVFSDVQNSFIVGRGNYKSANKAALRLVANELTDAYRECENFRIKDNNDIVGTRISVSKYHTVRDICDDLAGAYPKDYNWKKWHLGCQCVRTYIFKTPKELENEIRNNDNLSPETSKNYVADVPAHYNKWINNNQSKLDRLKTPPSFISENPQYTPKPRILTIDQIKKADRNNVITENIYLEGNTWKPERKALHDEIIAKYLNQDKGTADRVYMLGGAGANGKSSLTESGKLPHPKQTIVIDPDKVKGMIPEYKMMLESNDPNLIARAANFVHEESSYLGKEIRKQALTNNWATVLDGVNNNSAEKIHANAETVRKLSGKPVRADYVTLDTELSLKLAEIRAKKTGREVPKEVLLKANKSISKEFPAILENKSFDELYLWDTNENGNPRLILTQINGVTKMYNKELWDRFQKKTNY